VDLQPSVIASDSDGKVSRVEFYMDGAWRFTAYGPYVNKYSASPGTPLHPDWWVWGEYQGARCDLGGVSGWHTLTARAIDNAGAARDAQVSFYVNPWAQGYSWSEYRAHQFYQSAYTLTIPRGQTKYLTIGVQNVGSVPWYNYGPNPVRLASSHYNGANSAPSDWLTDTWHPEYIKLDRIAPLGGRTQSGPYVVYPWQSVYFTIPISIPSWYQPGTYSGSNWLHWNLVAEGLTWIRDYNGTSFGNNSVTVIVQ
jgi:hypothetical protein